MDNWAAEIEAHPFSRKLASHPALSPYPFLFSLKNRAGSSCAHRLVETRAHIIVRAPAACVHLIPPNNKESSMNIPDLSAIYDLLYAIGEILTTTWLGRIVLGAVIGSVLARFARL